MKLRVRPEAREDVASAAEWYDEQGNGLGDRFVSEYIEVLAKIEAAPLTFGLLETVPRELNLRRCQLNKFPYVVVFRTLPSELVVFAVIHASRHESFWLFRLD